MKNKLIYFFVVIVFVAIAYPICAQNKTSDSLKLALKIAKNDTTRCNILNALIEFENDDAIWPKYNDEILKISSIALKSEHDTTLIKFYKNKIGLSYINKGYWEQFVSGSSSRSIENYFKAVEILKALNDIAGLASAYNNIGSVYENIGDIKKAIEYYTLALVCKEKTNDIKGEALPLNNIGMIFHRQGDFEKAVEYYLKSIIISKRINYKHGIAFASNNLGLTFQKMKNYKLAESYFKSSIINWEQNNDKRMLSYAYNNLGCLYLEINNIESAKEMLNNSYKISIELNDKNVQVYTQLNFAKIFLIKNDVFNAEKTSINALMLAKETAFPDNIKSASLILKDIYKMKGDYKNSLKYYELYIQMRDSITNQETKKASIKSQLKYEYEKQAAADSVKHAEQQKVKDAQLATQSASLKQEKTQRYALYSGLLLVAGFLIFVINRFRVTQKQKHVIQDQKILVDVAYEKLHEKNKEVMDSIYYAQRIQKALITSEKYIDKQLNKLDKKY